MKSVCILGAGVSGLAFAFRLEQLHANCRVTIYEAEGQVGGRVRTVSRSGTLSDVGANYLTFDMLKQPEATEQFIRKELSLGLVQITKPVYLYDKFKGFRPGDRQSLRLAYKNGIGHLPEQLAAKLKATDIKLNCRIDSVDRMEGQWQISSGTSHQSFDALVVASPIPSVKDILRNYQEQETLANVEYTHQLTATFELVSDWPAYSSVLFFDHEMTFVCCHEEKTSSRVVNIQLGNEFSQKRWSSEDQAIAEDVLSLLPKELGLKLGNCLHIARWYPSLRSTKSNYQPKDGPEMNLIFIGDSTIEKSRVVASLQTGLVKAQLFQKVLLQNS